MKLAKSVRSAVCVLSFVAALPVSAATIGFNFEGETPTFVPSGGRTGALTALSLSNSGLTVSITRQGGLGFDLVQNTGENQDEKPSGFGLISLDPFISDSGAPFVLDFSSAITSFSIQFGDYGQDSPDILSVEAFSGLGGSGSLLAATFGTFAGDWDDVNSEVFGTGAVAAAAIRSIVMIGGSPAFPHSVFYDNIQVTTLSPAAVSEPGAIALIGVGLLGIAARRRRKVGQAVA